MRQEETIRREILEQRIDRELEALSEKLFGKKLEDASDEQVYVALLYLVKGLEEATVPNDGDKKIYYISAEFLIGKLLSNNLINLGIYEKVESVLKSKGKELSRIEEIEPEPSLGNGGLGRLAACFMDSIATLGLPGEGIGLNYHFGLFKQVFKDRLQTTEKNDWIEKDSWLNKTDVSFDVFFGDRKVTSRLYDIDVVGYNNGVNKLRLFDIESVDESIVKEGITFDKEAIEKNLTLFLYPDDSDEAGNLLRIYQQYFMVSNAAQLILMEMKEKQYDLRKMYDYAVIQINDTHPTMVIPELIRILTTEEGFTMDEAIDVVSHTCAYTNHTILAEALEKWPLAYIEEVVPQLVPIIKELSDRVAKKYKDEKVQIIDKDKRVHMAHIDIHYGYSVNGVAAIHTEILKQSELNHFYKIYPEKFNNKTNGITQRRFLLHGNPLLADWVTEYAGNGWITDLPKIEKIAELADDTQAQKEFMEIKYKNKVRLAKYIKEHNGIDVDPNSIFDVQVKRLHEYKRQFMNILHIMYLYDRLKKNPDMPFYPRTFIFGAKASAGYERAKAIIKLINSVGDVVNNDPTIKGKIKVVFIEDYRVSNAELIFAAADVSEQISTASKEASGTGNMKFMLNGALTLGTMDGANVEIHELVGDDNIYIFGKDSDTVIKHYEKADYVSKDYYKKSPVIKEAVDFIVCKEVLKVGKKENLERLYNELLNKDWFMTLLDLEDYIKVKDQAFADYEDQQKWKKMMLVNIAKAGFFSSDRTIAEYNRDIWKLK
mgnify:CR=1 FL=1